MVHPFQVGGRYRNAKGEYEVLAVDGDTITIRWTDGLTWEGSVALQARIFKRTQRQQRALDSDAAQPARGAMSRASRRAAPSEAVASAHAHGNVPPASPERLAAIAQALLGYGETIDPATLFPTLVPQAGKLVVSDPYAFALATCLDRQTRAEVIWTIPYDISLELGHLDPFRIYPMSLADLAALFSRLPRRPRFVNDAPETVQQLTRIVVKDCRGDASKMWVGRRASEVKRTFESIHGVGPGIASMAVLLLERGFPIRFDDLDRPHMDIKPDVHTVRVLYRLGVSDAQTEEAALQAARRLNPGYPGEVDSPLWRIGRGWCFARAPDCDRCPVGDVCARRLAW